MSFHIKIRNGDDANLAKDSWVIYMLFLDFRVVLGQRFLWSAQGIIAPYSGNLTAVVISLIVYFGLVCVAVSKLILLVTYKLKLSP